MPKILKPQFKHTMKNLSVRAPRLTQQHHRTKNAATNDKKRQIPQKRNCYWQTNVVSKVKVPETDKEYIGSTIDFKKNF